MTSMLNKNKKADLTANQIIAIVVLIVSFAVILLFFFMLDLKKSTDIEVCRNSVVMKSIKVFGGLTSFNCKTQDVLIKETEPEKIYAKLAELQRECFWMFGELKIDFAKDTCAICSIIEFEKKDAQLSISDYVNYLQKTNIPGEDVSYAFYLYRQPKLQPQGANRIDASKKYMVLFKKEEYSTVFGVKLINPFKTGEAIHSVVGIKPYTSDYLSKLDCEKFATSA